MSDYKLAELNVTIKEVHIGNKKLTKSIFNQIEFVDCFNQELDFIGETVLGYVKEEDGRYLLWVNDGKLRKTGLAKFSDLKNKVEYGSLDKTEWFLRKTKLEYDMSDDYRDRLSEGLKEHEKYLALVNKVKKFIDVLTDKQIFL